MLGSLDDLNDAAAGCATDGGAATEVRVEGAAGVGALEGACTAGDGDGADGLGSRGAFMFRLYRSPVYFETVRSGTGSRLRGRLGSGQLLDQRVERARGLGRRVGQAGHEAR